VLIYPFLAGLVVNQEKMANSLDRLLAEKQMPLQELADAAKLPVDRVEAIVMGRWLPSPDERQRIAAVLQVSVADIVWGHFMDPRNQRYRQFGLPEDFRRCR
jgi:hypothetical protein